jgi:NDP-4-keto-2,6-dideoxyhexose 3-C-methyltransferase
MSILSNIECCRLCKSSQIHVVITLGDQYITSRFPVYGDFSTPKTPIDLCRCAVCGLLQLYQTTIPSELYEYEYGYRSGISNTMRTHLLEYQLEILSKVELCDGDTIIDIGSNDSTMLQYYSPNLKRIGVDPTGSQFKEYYGEVELVPNYFTLENFKDVYGDRKAKVVSSISMFYDLPDPVQFAKDIYSVLEDDGIWTCEQSYMPLMIKTNSIDTICHEHLEYYGLTQIKQIADMARLKIIDVKFNDCNGGSFRVYFAKRESSLYSENIDYVTSILKSEVDMGIMTDELYLNFMKNCDKEVQKLREFIDSVNSSGQSIYVYGASTKGNCLLQYANLTETQLRYAVERNPKKVGKMTSTGIPIISEETMRESPPDFLLVLPWHFREEIIEREHEFLDGGGQLVFPFPTLDVVARQKKILITGCDGFISHYVKDRFKNYSLYGIGHKNPNVENGITKYYFDMSNKVKLERTLCSIRPDIIIHLAGISSSQYCFKNPSDAIHINGLITVNLCDIIYKSGLKSRLFNASSSEIYKGHVDYETFDGDTNMYHNHPYSIAKIMAHSTVDFYRNTYHLPFSNGVIFTTESPLKSLEFLLKKVAAHIGELKSGKSNSLTVGNLDSYRNIIHASDVANAIHTIVSQDEGASYLICGNESNKMLDLVLRLYDFSGIKLGPRNNNYYDLISGNLVLKINNDLGVDSIPINIGGEPNRLRALGWKPEFSVDDILKELL